MHQNQHRASSRIGGGQNGQGKDMAMFTVIIPFYQKEDGILRRALASVFAQGFQDFTVIVVDDESPHPIDRELEPLTAAQRARLTVLRQANAGPGGARNTGLDSVPADSQFVALLDSDDVWHPGHLQNARDALVDFGADCYFASIRGGGDFDYHFDVAELARRETATALRTEPLVIELPDMPSVMLKDWGFLHLSCMVIGRSLFETIRFDPGLRLAAEDVLFFCDCVKTARRVVLCDATGAERGEGINIFHGVQSDSLQFLKQQFNTWVALDVLESRFARSQAQRDLIRDAKDRARKLALWGQARLIKRGKVPQVALLLRWIRRDPALLRSAVALALGKVAR